MPVVQPDHGAFPELLASTGGGVLVPPGQPQALAEALYGLLVDRDRRRRLGDRGRRGVGEGHTAEAMARATIDLWRDLWRRGLDAGGLESAAEQARSR